MEIRLKRVQANRNSPYSYNMKTVLQVIKNRDGEDDLLDDFAIVVQNHLKENTGCIKHSVFGAKYIEVDIDNLKSFYLPMEFYQLCSDNKIKSKNALMYIEERLFECFDQLYDETASNATYFSEWYVEPIKCVCCYTEVGVEEVYVQGVKRQLCKDCLKRYYQRCPICGNLEHKGSMSVLDGHLICCDCLERLKKRYKKSVYFCIYCNEYHTMQKYGKNRCNETEWVCDYAKNHISTCAGCGMLIYNMQVFNSFTRQQYCEKCWQMKEKYLIKAYHADPEPEFYVVGEDGKNKRIESPHNGIGEFYGVELEVDAGGQRDDISEPTIKLLNEEVYAMRDGSLTNGFEIVTHPHTAEALFNMNWQPTFKYLVKQGYRSHDINTCGLHLHCNRSIFGNYDEEKRDNIAKLMWFFETYRKEFIKLSRREVQHINRWAKFYSSEEGKDMQFYRHIYDDFNRSSRHDDRYMAINLCKKKTIEFRLMRGTLNIDTFLATLDVLITISKNAMLISNDKISRAELWLNGIKEPTKKYLIENKIFVEELSKEVKPEELIKPKKTREKKQKEETKTIKVDPNDPFLWRPQWFEFDDTSVTEVTINGDTLDALRQRWAMGTIEGDNE